MRQSFLLSLGLTLLCFASCRERAPIEKEAESDDPAPGSAIAESSNSENPSSMPVERMETSETSIETPVAMQPQVSDRVERLSFAHGNGLCVQVNPDGQTSLQPCAPSASGQKFLFSRSLDGRVQLKDTSSQLCLSVGPIGFFVTVLRAEVCESKSTQFFSVVDYGSTYSLKFDANNTCIDAERSRAEPGTRLILYRCTAVLNQKILLVKP